MIAQRHKFAWSGPFNFNKSFQNTFQIAEVQIQPDHWSCIACLSAEDMLKSAVIEEKKF